MTQWKYVCRAIGVVILVAIPNACSPAESKTPPKGERPSRESEADSAARTPNETDTDRSKIVGKGVYTLEQLNGMPGFSLINPCFRPDPKKSDPLEFVRKNPESGLKTTSTLRTIHRSSPGRGMGQSPSPCCRMR